VSRRGRGEDEQESSRLGRWTKAQLVDEILALRARLPAGAPTPAVPDGGRRARRREPSGVLGLGSSPSDGWERFRTRLSTVHVPREHVPTFLKAQEYVARYFRDRIHRPDEATISIAGERYVLMRAASMSVEFVELVTSLYQDRGPQEARSVADNLLFDLAHAIGKADARSFHEKMGVDDPIERLSAGPVHFAFSGWAFVVIDPSSRPTPDDDFYLAFEHPFSFESHAWLEKNRTSPTPVCVMNAGYSSGWCEESFGLPLVAAEIECVAAGGDHCRFVMAPPSRIEDHLRRLAQESGRDSARGSEPAGSRTPVRGTPAVTVPEFFQRRRLEDELRRANEQLEERVRRRTAQLERTNERLQLEIAERRLAEEQLRLLGTAVESASEGIFILATGLAAGEHRITFVNQGLTRITGRAAEALIGKSLDALGIADDERPVVDALNRSIVEGRAFQAEATAARSDGTEYALELHLMPAGQRVQSSVHWIGIVRDVSERKSQLAALRRQALHDALTDLPNRILLYDRLEQEILETGRSGRSLALLFMDLNGFKEINDTFGHHCGDQLLRQVGPRLRPRMRSTDTLARLGGDEFAILLPDVGDAEGATRVAESLLGALVEPFRVEHQQLTVGASIGIVLSPEHGDDAGTLMRRADVAMYVAKNGARGCEVYSAESDAHSPARLALLGQLRRDECREQLVLHFQPEIELATGRTLRMEALVRWQHPEHGLLLPKDFIPLAEAGNAMEIVTDWVLGAAIRECRRWQRKGYPVGVSVNLSPLSLHDAALPGEIALHLAAADLDPSSLVLEITEGSLLADPDHATHVLAKVLDLGVGLAIDDFGTGYSSLAHLKRLPVSEIKIDRSFVRDLTRVEHDEAIVRSIIDLGHSLGCRIVAEGIEERETLDRLLEMRCDLGQGYLLGRPLDPARLDAWLRTSPRPSSG
jgi:diguanylate cyclase (GGDEF)-like protein/PAS domain S-box-containing protein